LRFNYKILKEWIDQSNGQKYIAANGNGLLVFLLFDVAPEYIIKIQKEHHIIDVVYNNVIV
jgi:hypothetical protein